MNTNKRLPRLKSSVIQDFTLNSPLNQKDFKSSVLKYSPRGDPFQYLTHSVSKTQKLRPVCPSRNFNSSSNIHSPRHSVCNSPGSIERIYTDSVPILSNQLHIYTKRFNHKLEQKKESYSSSTPDKLNLRIRRITINTAKELTSYKESDKLAEECRIDSNRSTIPSFSTTDRTDILSDSRDLELKSPTKKPVKYSMKFDVFSARKSLRNTSRYNLKAQPCFLKKSQKVLQSSKEDPNDMSFGEIRR